MRKGERSKRAKSQREKIRLQFMFLRIYIYIYRQTSNEMEIDKGLFDSSFELSACH